MLVQNWPLVYRDDGFRSWWRVAHGTGWSDGVVLDPPLFDDDFYLMHSVEDTHLGVHP